MATNDGRKTDPNLPGYSWDDTGMYYNGQLLDPERNAINTIDRNPPKFTSREQVAAVYPGYGYHRNQPKTKPLDPDFLRQLKEHGLTQPGYDMNTGLPLNQAGQGVPQAPFTGGSSLGLNAYSGGASNSYNMPTTGMDYANGQPAGGMPAPLGGQTPLADAMLQGYGMGLAPFNTQFYNQLGNSLFQQATQNYNDNINPALNSQAITAGGYGGDRSNLAKGVMSDRLNQSVFNALIPQVTSGYENWLNRGVNTGQAAGQNLLGLGALDISAYNAQNQAASGAANAAGVQSYTNPWATGIGTAISMWPFINSMFGSPTNPNQNRTIVEPA